MEEPRPSADVKEARPRHGAAWGARARPESRWAAQLAVIVAILLYASLPAKLTFGPVWLVPALEITLLLPLMVTAPRELLGIPSWRRPAALALICIINLANIGSLALLVHELVSGNNRALGGQLFLGSVKIWMTNIIVFALWYWELDRGGPDARMSAEHSQPDFLFPQMVTPGSAPPGWAPKFVDYLFVSFTNASAFSPTDTMPLTAWAKMLFLVQAAASLLTVALVAARAVNILQ